MRHLCSSFFPWKCFVPIMIFFFLSCCYATYSGEYSKEEYTSCLQMIELLPLTATENSIELALLYCGLFPYIQDHLIDYPPHLYQFTHRGIGIDAYPSQLPAFLRFVKRFPINTFVHYRVSTGGTFIFATEYLRKYYPDIKSVGIDTRSTNETVPSPYDGILQDYVTEHTNASLLSGNITDFITTYPDLNIDLLFVDGNYSYDDLLNILQPLFSRTKLVLLHNVVATNASDMVKFWTILKEAGFDEQLYEFNVQYNKVLPRQVKGLGLLLNPFFYLVKEVNKTESEKIELAANQPELFHNANEVIAESIEWKVNFVKPED